MQPGIKLRKYANCDTLVSGILKFMPTPGIIRYCILLQKDPWAFKLRTSQIGARCGLSKYGLGLSPYTITVQYMYSENSKIILKLCKHGPFVWQIAVLIAQTIAKYNVICLKVCNSTAFLKLASWVIFKKSRSEISGIFAWNISLVYSRFPKIQNCQPESEIPNFPEIQKFENL